MADFYVRRPVVIDKSLGYYDKLTFATYLEKEIPCSQAKAHSILEAVARDI